MFKLLLNILHISNIDNYNFLNNHNDKSYEVGVNDFINRTYTNEYFISNNNFIKTNYNIDIDIEYPEIIPNSIDWRKKNKVSSVKNQLNCGSCWAFSAAESIESKWAINNNILYNLSEQQLIDCSSDYGNNGCSGGSMDLAFKYVIDNGLCLNNSYPYIGEEGICKECDSVVNINNYTDIKPNNEHILKKTVSLQPVSVAIQANKRSFQFYKSGVYSDLECGTQLDHGVLVVGYGYDNFYDKEYWIVKNSWGESWGENGYIRLLRNVKDKEGICGIAMQPSIPIIKSNVELLD